MVETRLRHAARVLLIDECDRVLLFRFGPTPKGRYVWLPPGGGLEAGETHEQAAHRELLEEVAIEGVELGPCRWEREHTFDWTDHRICQRERWYLVRCPVLHLDPAHVEGLRPEGIDAARWWSLAELASTSDFLVPRRLADLVADVLAGRLPQGVGRLDP